MKLIILDRDGVINNDSDAYIKSPAEWQPIPGSLQAIAQLHQAGFTIAIATNQSGIGRGYFPQETLADIHKKMLAAIEEAGGQIAYVAFCPHTPDDHCECRKPKPGLLYEIARVLQCDLSQAMVIGDSLRDIQAGQAVKADVALVLTGKGEKTLEKHSHELQNVPVYSDLASLVKKILTEHPLSESR